MVSWKDSTELGRERNCGHADMRGTSGQYKAFGTGLYRAILRRQELPRSIDKRIETTREEVGALRPC